MQGASASPQRLRQLGWLLLSAAVIVLDQQSKTWIGSHLGLYEMWRILPVLNLTHLHNPGAAFDFLSAGSGWQRWLFAGLAGVASVALVAWLAWLESGARLLGAALSLILAGALGNLIDRLRYGYVVDFLDFHWGAAHFWSFNVADSAITVGAALLLLDSWLGSGRRGGA